MDEKMHRGDVAAKLNTICELYDGHYVSLW